MTDLKLIFLKIDRHSHDTRGLSVPECITGYKQRQFGTKSVGRNKKVPVQSVVERKSFGILGLETVQQIPHKNIILRLQRSGFTISVLERSVDWCTLIPSEEMPYKSGIPSQNK